MSPTGQFLFMHTRMLFSLGFRLLQFLSQGFGGFLSNRDGLLLLNITLCNLLFKLSDLSSQLAVESELQFPNLVLVAFL